MSLPQVRLHRAGESFPVPAVRSAQAWGSAAGRRTQVRIQMVNTVCIERFKDYPQLGRFTLRDEGRTVAIGKVEKLRPMATAVAVAGGSAGAK